MEEIREITPEEIAGVAPEEIKEFMGKVVFLVDSDPEKRTINVIISENSPGIFTKEQKEEMIIDAIRCQIRAIL